MRELREELEIDIELTKENFFATINHDYADLPIVRKLMEKLAVGQVD